MITRILIGLALIAGLAVVVLADGAIGHPVLACLCLVALTLQAERELLNMMASGRAPRLTVIVGTLGIFLGPVLAARWGREEAGAMLLPFVLGVLLVLTRGVMRLQRQATGDAQPAGLAEEAAAGVLALAYLALPMGLLASMAIGHESGRGTLFVAALVLVSKCGDIGGYLVGTLAGRHRVLPNVSPKKSYEGSAGGLVLTLALTLIIGRVMPDLFGLPWPRLVLLAVVVNLATQLGDFAESMIKRSCGVKDSAALLPTFGGALDIIDSLVFAAPAAALVLGA